MLYNGYYTADEYIAMADNAMAQRPNIEAIADEVHKAGYDRLFLIGIGGSIAYEWQLEAVLKRSSIPVWVENAAEFNVRENPLFTDKSVALFISVSGDTPELVEAAKLCKKKGGRMIGILDKEVSPLADLADYRITSKGGTLYKMFTLGLRLMQNKGEFDAYDRAMEQLAKIAHVMLPDIDAFNDTARAYALNNEKAPIQFMVSSGNLWGGLYAFAMCVMEERLWKTTRPIEAAEFFHGVLEVVEKETCVLLVKGEDETRPLMDRVERFVNKISANVWVVDSAKCKLPGIDPEFRWLMSPIVCDTLCERISSNFEEICRHPQQIRRYYRVLDY